MNTTGNCSLQCPFTHMPCTDCSIYRGRHHYFMFSGNCKGTDQTKDLIQAYFQGLEESTNPWINKSAHINKDIEDLLGLKDMEN